MTNSISVKEFKKIENKNILILDVRDPIEFETLPKIEKSINIPIRVLTGEGWDKFINEYEKDCTIITVCNAGNRSSAAAEYLYEHGYKNAKVLTGGVLTYMRHK